MFLDEAFPPSNHATTHGVPSPPPSPPQTTATINSPPTFDDLDDVFGSAPSSPSQHPTHPRPNIEPSEIPRLRSAHSTNGYRDGIAAAKGECIQAGFDEGFSLGAMIGLRVGEVLGVLEGLYAAVKKSNGEEGELLRLGALLERARRELMTEEVFGRQWWGEDGIWKYKVKGEVEGEEMEVTFRDVALAHPGIKRWETIVGAEVERLGLKLGVLEAEGDADGGD